MTSLKLVAYNAWPEGQLPQVLIQLWCGSSLSITFLICISHLMWILEPKWNPSPQPPVLKSLTLSVAKKLCDFLIQDHVACVRFSDFRESRSESQLLKVWNRSFLSQESIQLPFLANSKWQTVWQWKKFSPLVNLRNFPTKRNKAVSSRAIIPIWRR